MKVILIIITSLTFANSYGQFAVTNDQDGFVNIRASGEINSRIIDTLFNGHVIWCFEPEGNWLLIDYSKNGISKTGYLYRNRVRFLSTYDTIPIVTSNQLAITHKNDSINVTIEQTNFQQKNNKVQYETVDDFKYVSKINGKPIWGTDGNIPKRIYKSIKAVLGNRHIAFPHVSLENLFEPNLHYSECYYDKQNDILYLSAMNSDGAGGYVVIWIVEKGIYKSRFVANGF